MVVKNLLKSCPLSTKPPKKQFLENLKLYMHGKKLRLNIYLHKK